MKKLLLVLLMLVSPLMAQETDKEKSKIVRPVFSIFTSASVLVAHGSLGTSYAPLSVSGFEFYLGIPKIYFYTSLAYAYSLVDQTFYDPGNAIYVKGGFGGHVYNKSNWTLALNGGILISVIHQDLEMGEFFGDDFNPQGHRALLGIGGFINLRAFYHFNKDIALMLGYDLTLHSPQSAYIVLENNISIGLAF